MLDVHPPHESVHTWRDFFIHIATIVVGLIIAVGLEQGVEAIHHRHQREELREDLRVEARQRILRLDSNVKTTASDLAWYREIMRVGREAQASDGFVTFTFPPKKRLPYIADTANGVWTAAKASGVVAVLPREEIELWDSVEGDLTLADRDFTDREAALKATFAFYERLGIHANPGDTLRLTVKDRDDLMAAIANLYEATWQFERDEAYWKGASQGILDGAKTTDELVQYAGRSVDALPK